MRYTSIWLVTTAIAVTLFHLTYGRVDELAPNPLGAVAAITLTFAGNTAYVSALANARKIPRGQMPMYIAAAAVLTPVVDLAAAALLIAVTS